MSLVPRRPNFRSLMIWGAWLGCMVSQAAAQPPVLQVELTDRTSRGLPIYWSRHESLLLLSDGSIEHYTSDMIRKHQVLAETFEPLSLPQMRSMLQQSHGQKMELQSTSSFIIAAPKGESEAWGRRFSQLQASFQRFFATRGWQLRAPEFPLVAMVYPSFESFQQSAAQQGIPISGRTLGYYSAMTNRMYLYQQDKISSEWFDTDSTILHEATHQLAYNLGVHQRLSSPPLWVIEGLASLFESPEFALSTDRAMVAQRLNRARYQTWLEMAKTPKATLDLLEQLMRSDRLFKQDPDQAYALAWALSFYLAERDGKRYIQYLQHLSKLEPYRDYAEGERVSDFKQWIASDPAVLLTNIDRFLRESL